MCYSTRSRPQTLLPENLEAVTYAVYEEGKRFSALDLHRALEFHASVTRSFGRFFEEYDLLLCPAAASAAQPHDHEGERWTRTVTVNNEQVLTTDQLFWAGISGVVYLPATVAPAGLTRANLPVGIQIIGPNFGDHTCIEFARLIEEAP